MSKTRKKAKNKRRTTEQVIRDEMKKGIKIVYKYPSTYSTRSSSKELLKSMFPDHPE